MNIDILKLREWRPPHARSYDLRESWDIITREYCTPMTLSGICPSECQLCRAHIESIYKTEAARNPMALLTWRAKQEYALMQEERAKRPELEESVSDVGNPFAAFLESFA